MVEYQFLLLGQVQLALVIGGVLFWVVRSSRRSSPSDDDIPTAEGAVPVLGHALRYKSGPAAFLADQARRLGPVFRLNLAGKRMVLIAGSPDTTRQVTFASDAVISATRPLLLVGFGEALGTYSVLEGGDFHKRVVKEWLSAGAIAEEIPELHRALAAELAAELDPAIASANGHVKDLFGAVRRCVLRASIRRLLGSAVLDGLGPSFIDDFARFQDCLEEAVAKASVLPRWASLPIALWPVQRQRLALYAALDAVLPGAMAAPESAQGPWLLA